MRGGRGGVGRREPPAARKHPSRRGTPRPRQKRGDSGLTPACAAHREEFEGQAAAVFEKEPLQHLFHALAGASPFLVQLHHFCRADGGAGGGHRPGCKRAHSHVPQQRGQQTSWLTLHAPRGIQHLGLPRLCARVRVGARRQQACSTRAHNWHARCARCSATQPSAVAPSVAAPGATRSHALQAPAHLVSCDVRLHKRHRQHGSNRAVDAGRAARAAQGRSPESPDARRWQESPATAFSRSCARGGDAVSEPAVAMISAGNCDLTNGEAVLRVGGFAHKIQGGPDQRRRRCTPKHDSCCWCLRVLAARLSPALFKHTHAAAGKPHHMYASRRLQVRVSPESTAARMRRGCRFKGEVSVG